MFPISVLHQTTTYNPGNAEPGEVFPVSVLHQTTTGRLIKTRGRLLFPVSVLHQTTTVRRKNFCIPSCSLYPFYIKPQLNHSDTSLQKVVPCVRSTSNHNDGVNHLYKDLLFPVSVLHQTTTPCRLYTDYGRCFLYPFYIKPQLLIDSCLFSFGVSCLHSTSNHNLRRHTCNPL